MHISIYLYLSLSIPIGRTRDSLSDKGQRGTTGVFLNEPDGKERPTQRVEMMKQNVEVGEGKSYGVIGGKSHRSKAKCRPRD